MPVYTQRYRFWEGRLTPRWLRWTVITRYHLRQSFSGKSRTAITALVAISVAICFAFLAYIYLRANVSLLTLIGVRLPRLPPVNREFFLYAIEAQAFVIGLLTLVVGSNLIADDRRDNAIPLYLSKPLTRLDYLIGKFSVLAFFLLCVTAVPANLLFVFEALMEGGWAFVKGNWALPLALTGFSFLITALCGAVMLMASSLVKKGAVAGIVVIGLFVGHNVLAGILSGVFRSPKLRLFSLLFDMDRIGLWVIVGDNSRRLRDFRFTGPEALGVVLAVTAACALILWVRIRPVEVVK